MQRLSFMAQSLGYDFMKTFEWGDVLCPLNMDSRRIQRSFFILLFTNQAGLVSMKHTKCDKNQ